MSRTSMIEMLEFSVLQFHFHAPSEHTFGLEHNDLEMHIVHKSSEGEYAALAVVFNQHWGESNEFLDDVIAAETAETEIDLLKVFDG